MLDIKFIITNLELIKKNIQKRGTKADLDNLVALYHQRKLLLNQIEQKQAEANKIAKNLLSIATNEKDLEIARGRSLNREIEQLNLELKSIDLTYQDVLLTIPNLLAEDTPLGQSDAENVPLRYYLEPTQFNFVAKNHLELGKSLDLIDFESGTKVTGAKFYFLKNAAVLLESALKLFAFKVAQAHDFTPLITPDLAKTEMLVGTGFSPRGEESNIYNLADLDLSLIATAEITVGGMHANEILSTLPLKYVAESHCFRREAGAGGQESRGLYRVHQFSKIELFQITAPDKSEQALQEILAIEEKIYQQLRLPYRVVRICAGDLGAAAFKKYDIEVWMPGKEAKDKYGEVTSASNCTDFQSRRLKIRYRGTDGQKFYPHTLNGTAIASSRTIMAILENYQQADGSVVVPEVLRDYVGLDVIRRN